MRRQDGMSKLDFFLLLVLYVVAGVMLGTVFAWLMGLIMGW